MPTFGGGAGAPEPAPPEPAEVAKTKKQGGPSPVWRLGAFAGEFCDAFIKDTDLEGGHTGPVSWRPRVRSEPPRTARAPWPDRARRRPSLPCRPSRSCWKWCVTLWPSASASARC